MDPLDDFRDDFRDDRERRPSVESGADESDRFFDEEDERRDEESREELFREPPERFFPPFANAASASRRAGRRENTRQNVSARFMGLSLRSAHTPPRLLPFYWKIQSPT
ncbi:MAG: hypothetical protein ABFS86_21055 [Planctomycetota bacterium]